MLEPKNPQLDDAIILEFKVYDPDGEKTLKDTVQEALDRSKENPDRIWMDILKRGDEIGWLIVS